MKEGRIVKALSGFYYVQVNGTIYECRGRGVFRKRNITPLVGDHVVFEKTNHQKGYILEIKPRKNELDRPPIANIDQATIVCSAVEPDFSSALLDKFLVKVETKQIRPIIFITKLDLATEQIKQEMALIKDDYEQLGYPVELIVSKEGSDLSYLTHYFSGQVTVIAGQSGVGKSSILNAINPALSIKTGEISTSLGRGRHTTRHVELIEIGDGLVADTPGFSSLELNDVEVDVLSDCFPEMRMRKGMCQFRGCLHDREPRCAIKQALEQGDIKEDRYKHYLTFLHEIQSRKPRY